MSDEQKPTYPVHCDVYLDREKIAVAIAEWSGVPEKPKRDDDEEKPEVE